MVRAVLLAAVPIFLAVAPAAAGELYCRQLGSVFWANGAPQSQSWAEGEWGGVEFWLDTSTGIWRERHIGGRALYSGGGTLQILNAGTGYGSDWTGITSELSEMVRINLRIDPSPYVRVLRDYNVETGICIDPGDTRYIDGEPVEE